MNKAKNSEFEFKLVKYKGPHSDKLYHVVDNNGVIVRNATHIEVELWERLQELN